MHREFPTPQPLPTSLFLTKRFSTLHSIPSRPHLVLKLFHCNSSAAYQEVLMHQIASQVTIGVVAFIEVYIENGQLGIVMEECQSRNVKEVRSSMGTEGWKELELLRVIKEMMEIVRKLHQAGIAHGNLELENWLVSRKNCLRLTDFGRAVHVAGSDVASEWEFERRSSPFEQDVNQLGKNLYQMTLNKPCRYSENTPKDLLESDISKKIHDCGYSDDLSKLIYVLIECKMTLTESISFAEAALKKYLR